MYGLISTVYSPKQRKDFESLYLDSDSDVQMLMRASLAQALKDSPKIIPSHGTDWILCTLTQYHKSDDDTVRVFHAIIKHLNKIEFGLLTEEIKWKKMNEIADSCLVGVAFFRKRIEQMNSRKAFPSVDYLTKVGSLAFHRIGFEQLAEDFSGWTSFIEDEIVSN